MEWITTFVAVFGAVGVLWALRDYFTGSKIINKRDPNAPETGRDKADVARSAMSGMMGRDR